MSRVDRWPWRRVLVRGGSMVPSLQDGDVVVVRTRAPAKPGDVVLVRWDARPEQLSVKRALREDGAGWHVRGDNAAASTDSRSLGPARVFGVVVCRLWPKPRRVRRVQAE